MKYFPYGIDLTKEFYLYKNIGWWHKADFEAKFNNRKFRRWNYLRRVKSYEKAREYVRKNAKNFSKIIDEDGVYKNAVDDKFLVYLKACRTDEFGDKVRYHHEIMKLSTYSDWKEHVVEQITDIKGKKNQENFLFYLKCRMRTADFLNSYGGVAIALLIGASTLYYSYVLQTYESNTLYPAIAFSVLIFVLAIYHLMLVYARNMNDFLREMIKISQEYFKKESNKCE